MMMASNGERVVADRTLPHANKGENSRGHVCGSKVRILECVTEDAAESGSEKKGWSEHAADSARTDEISVATSFAKSNT